MKTNSRASPELDLSLLVHPKERLYFGIAVVLSIAIYAVLVATVLTSAEFAGIIIFYAIIIGLIYLIVHGLFIGHVRGNGIRVSPSQFPELMALADAHARRLGMEETPAIFILQAGGVLNAFAAHFLGRNFVVLFSDILALANEKGERAVSFVLGHELGHVRRKHMTWRGVLFPAMAVPFLGSAYSRACEYTCDRFGNALEPEAGVDGLLVLAAGRDLYHQVNSSEFGAQRETESGFFVRFAEILATHPHLTKRVAALSVVRHRQPISARAVTQSPVVAS
ncbi:MAG: M48 family metallopeptidase [Gemmatimonadaceae bacterium]